MTPEEDIAEIQIGIEAEAFMASPIGQILAARANELRAEALEQLASAAPSDKDEIQRLQGIAWKAGSFVGWIRELIEYGNETFARMQQEEQDNSY